MLSHLIHYQRLDHSAFADELCTEVDKTIELYNKYKNTEYRSKSIAFESTSVMTSMLLHMSILKDHERSQYLLQDKNVRSALLKLDHTAWLFSLCQQASNTEYLQWLLQEGWGDVFSLAPKKRSHLQELLTGRIGQNGARYFMHHQTEPIDAWIRSWLPKYGDLFVDMFHPTIEDLRCSAQQSKWKVTPDVISSMWNIPEFKSVAESMADVFVPDQVLDKMALIINAHLVHAVLRHLGIDNNVPIGPTSLDANF